MKEILGNKLAVHIPSEYKETIEYGSLKLYFPKNAFTFNQHSNREQSGVVVGVPKHFKNVKEGDTVWYHHNITTGHENRLSVGDKNVTLNPNLIDGKNKIYSIQYSENEIDGYNVLIYAIKDKDTGQIKSVNDFIFGVPNEETQSEETKNGLWTPKRQEKGFKRECKIKYANDNVIESINVSTDDLVGVIANADYVMDIEDNKVWRFRKKDIVYKRINDEFTAVGEWVIVEMDKPDTHTPSGLEIPKNAQKLKRTGKILSAGLLCKEVNEGEQTMILKEGEMFKMYDNVFATKEKNLIPSYFINAIKEWQQKD